MTETQDFFVSVLNLMKGELFCFLQSYNEGLIHIVKQINGAKVENDYAAYFPLCDKDKAKLIEHVLEFHSEEDTNYFALQKEGKIIFAAYDNFEIADITSDIELSPEFIKKFIVTKLCIIVDEIKPFMYM